MTHPSEQPYESPPPAPGSSVQPEDRAKQGRGGRRAFLVLAVSLVLAVAALFALWGGHAAHSARHGGPGDQSNSAADARQFNTQPASPGPAP